MRKLKNCVLFVICVPVYIIVSSRISERWSASAKDDETSKYKRLLQQENSKYKRLLQQENPSEEIDRLKLSPVHNALPPCLHQPVQKSRIIKVDKTEVWDLSHLSATVNTISGGRWRPSDCQSQHKVAILVPYRDRAHMIGTWLQHMHPFLQKQQLEYGIYFIEQDFSCEFNRGALLNIGAQTALKMAPYDCFVFHDIDYLPENIDNSYGCPDRPTHYGTMVECKKWKKLWSHHFGGVSSIPTKHYLMVNGFSNAYFGWGSEDDDLSVRLHFEGLNITQRSRKQGRYRCLSHTQADPGTGRYQFYRRAYIRYKEEGFSTVKYEVLRYTENALYTWIYVHLDKEKIREEIFRIQTKLCAKKDCSILPSTLKVIFRSGNNTFV